MSKFCIGSKNGFEMCPRSPNEVSYHIQLPLNGVVEIPDIKPPKEQIFNSVHEIDISKCTTVIVKKPPGKKVLVVGNFMIGIEYISKTEQQKVHFVHWDIPFQALIKNDDGSLLDIDFDGCEFIVHVCVEHEEYTQVDERTIAYEVVLLIWLQYKGD